MIQLKRLTITQKYLKMKRKYSIKIYLTSQEFNKLTAENFSARLAQAKLATKADFDDFVKETDFENKPKNIKKKVTSNKAKQVLVENELDELLEKVELILAKGLTL